MLNRRHKESKVSQSLQWTKIWYLSFVSSLFLSNSHLVSQLRNHCDCCFLTNSQLMLQWCRQVILMWPWFGKFLCEVVMKVAVRRVPKFHHNEATLRLLTMVLVISLWSLQETITWESPGDFIVMSLGDSLQCNGRGNFPVRTKWDDHMRVTKWIHSNVIWWHTKKQHS